MPLNLRQYNLKPNSNYNVSVTIKKGDRVIDGLRSIYVSTPKYLTTEIENTSTASTIVFDRSYQKNTIKEPSVKVTAAQAAKSPSTQIKQFNVKNIQAPFDALKHKVTKSGGTGGKKVTIFNVDDLLTITVTLNGTYTYTGPVTLSSSDELLRGWFNRPYNINLQNSNTFKMTLTPRDMDPSVYWQPMSKSSYWASKPLSALKKGFNPADATTDVSYNVHHPGSAAVPGSQEDIPGEYQDVQGLVQTLRTSVQNQDLISQLYWDDIDQQDAIRDVIYFFFRDDTNDTDAVLGRITEWIYLDDEFVPAYPNNVGNTARYVASTGKNLSKVVPQLDENYLSLSEPIISLNKTIYQTTKMFENLQTPTQVRVAFTIARYKKDSATGSWAGTWLKTIPSGTYKDYPVLSSSEILSGSG
jgi:hypothetical protein